MGRKGLKVRILSCRPVLTGDSLSVANPFVILRVLCSKSLIRSDKVRVGVYRPLGLTLEDEVRDIGACMSDGAGLSGIV